MNAKKIRRIATAALLLSTAVHTLAIEGLKLTLQCQDVVLTWPSVEGETYIVQYRPSLDTNSTWQTLTASLPAETGTTNTTFIHSNVVQMAQCANGDSFAPLASSGSENSLIAEPTEEAAPPEPLAFPNNGAGEPVPLMLFPPGFDLTGYTIVDPLSGTVVSGAAFMQASSSLDPSDPPLEEGDGGTNGVPEFDSETGFYRVVRNGVYLYGLTNGMTLSGSVTFPVEVGAVSGELTSVSIHESGSPVGDSQLIAPFTNSLNLILDTTSMSNGMHVINGHAFWNPVGSEGEGLPIEAESEAILVNIYNEVSFPDWIEHFGELGDSVFVGAQLGHPDALYYIDIFGSSASYIGTLSGETHDGRIYGWWNLVGPDETLHNDQEYFDFVFTSVYDDGLESPAQNRTVISSPVTKRTYRQNDNWTGPGMWVVANQQAWQDKVGSDNLDTATDSFIALADGLGLTARPNHPLGEAFRLQYGNDVSGATKAAQWQLFRSAIYDSSSRNLFYFGHGGPDRIGQGPGTNLFITASEIASRLFTIPSGQTNRHAYRFVFLYGCETASGTLPESFGILHRQNVPGEYYVDAALTKSAFIGWEYDQSAAYGDSTVTDNANFIQHFLQEWSSGFGVYDALQRAKNNYSDVGFIQISKLKVYGYWELRPNSGNH